MVDQRKRSIAKAISWKILGLMILLVIALVVTESFRAMTVIALVYHLCMVLLYVYHECIWNKVPWGTSSGLFIQMTGMSGAGKSTLAESTAKVLQSKGYNVEIIDGDVYRENLCKDLGFSKEDRNTNIRRLSFVGNKLADNKVICLMAAINPYKAVREEIKSKYPSSKEVYISCNLESLKLRDPKGLYRRALLPAGHPEHIPNFTGISDPFEAPEKPDLEIETDSQTLEESTNILTSFILNHI